MEYNTCQIPQENTLSFNSNFFQHSIPFHMHIPYFVQQLVLNFFLYVSYPHFCSKSFLYINTTPNPFLFITLNI